MNPSPSTDRPPAQGGAPRVRLQLSATQLIASALAAVTATIAASYLGVSGTVIGAAIASVVTVTGNAVYSHSLHRTGQRVRTAVPIRRAAVGTPGSGRPGSGARPPAPPAAEPRSLEPPRPARTGRLGWYRLAFATAAVFVALLALITTVDLVAGRPLSDVVRGRQAQGATPLGNPVPPAVIPVPTVTRTVVPKVVITTPTVIETAPAVTKSAPPRSSASAAPSSSTAPTSAPSPTGSGSPVPTATPTP